MGIIYLRQETFKSLNLVLARIQLSAGQFEERRTKLQQQDVWQAVLVYQQNALDTASHADSVKFVAHPLESRGHRGILLEKWVLGAESVVGQRVPATKGLR